MFLLDGSPEQPERPAPDLYLTNSPACPFLQCTKNAYEHVWQNKYTKQGLFFFIGVILQLYIEPLEVFSLKLGNTNVGN